MDFVSKGGKYSRPFITLATYDALTGGHATMPDGADVVSQLSDSVLRAAVSIEMFHKASLVHDDIEDDDIFRYGQPTMHRQYGWPTAINVGDYMIGMGYRLVSRDSAALGAEVAADILDLLAGSHLRLCEGQGAELLWRDAREKRLTPLDALKVYALKTAPAFEAALLTGARLAGKIDDLAEPLKLFSRNIGVAFQIINDLNDWQGDAHNKLSAGGDVLAGRPTVLLALALAGLSPAEQEELLSMVDRREDLSDLQRLHRVEELYRKADVFEQARRLIDKHQQRAIEAADSVSNQPLQQLLRYLVDTVLERSEPAAPVLVDIGIKSLPITTA
jgi:geranylgeranyl pyrophosphate synthase